MLENGDEDDVIHSPQFQRGFYHPICSEDEIDRIMAGRDANDYLLKLRADTAVDHMRIFRVLRNFYRMAPQNWTLTGFFERHQQPFRDYLSLSSNEHILPVYGFVFSNDPNAFCLRSPFGQVISVSWSIKYFLQFMNIAYIDFGVEIPQHVIINSQRIAIRTMLKTEALDFLMDPRGIVPVEVGRGLDQIIPRQLRFVFGHEYGHYALHHLDDKSVISRPLFDAIRGEEDDPGQPHYSCSQRQELEADAYAISTIAARNEGEAAETLRSAVIYFAYLDLYEQVADQIFPTPPWRLMSHPKPNDRIAEILRRFGKDLKIEDDFVTPLLNNIGNFKTFFQEDIATHFEAYEFYGSVYFDKPNTEWRGPELRDRVDYY